MSMHTVYYNIAVKHKNIFNDTVCIQYLSVWNVNYYKIRIFQPGRVPKSKFLYFVENQNFFFK